MSLLFTNNALGTLASPITSVAASLTLNTGQAAAFPNPTSPDIFYATLTDAATQTLIEIVQVTAVSGNVFAINRAQDGTTALSWLAGDFISHRVVALELRLLNSVVPSGGILLWSGSVATVPQGWALCNGLNGTPNLMDSFVIGAGNTYAVGSTGGATSVVLSQAQLPAHTHTATAVVTDPGHFHNTNQNFIVSGTNQTGLGSQGAQIVSNPQTDTKTTGISVAVTNSSVGSGTAVPILPPYYALAYIMKL